MLADHPLLPLYFYVNKHLVKPEVQGWYDNVMNVVYSKDLELKPAGPGRASAQAPQPARNARAPQRRLGQPPHAASGRRAVARVPPRARRARRPRATAGKGARGLMGSQASQSSRA